jgi:hypothetical protein
MTMTMECEAVKYSKDADGVETWRFATVTVMRREGKEAVAIENSCRKFWYGVHDNDFSDTSSREEAEVWCREQLKPPEPKWRPAAKDGSDNGKECRFRDREEAWGNGKLLMHEPSANNPWVILSNGVVNGWDECEVPE